MQECCRESPAPCASSEAEQGMSVMDLRAPQWHEDLDYLVEALRREHRNLFHAVSPENFDGAVRSLHRRIPLLAGHAITVELARLVALIGDGHTCLTLTEVVGFRRYPLRLYQYADGLFVQAIMPEHGSGAGGRLLAIGDTPATEAYDLVRPLISRDNEMGVTAMAPHLLTVPEVLQARGVLADPEHASYVVQRPSGELLTCVLRPVDMLPPDLAAAHAGRSGPLPLWRQRSLEENWCTSLAEERALYVQYNRVRDAQSEPVATFVERVFTVVEQERVERVILDIRLNQRGNMALNRPLIHHLIRCDQVNQWGRLFVLIGRLTFSAAMNLAVDLERHTRALFVGEPTGARPNHYGENVAITLPHSNLHCSVSAFWWQYSVPSDDRPWIAPDIPAALWSEDDRLGRDPALAAALRVDAQSIPPVEDRHDPDYLGRRLR